MKLAMLAYSTKPRGGVVHALKLAERLSELGVDVTVYSLARSDDDTGLRRFFRDVMVPFDIFPYEWHPDLTVRLQRMIGAYTTGLPREADIYHAQDCVGGTALARMKSEGIISAPTFRTVHHIDDFAEPRLAEFEKQAIVSAEHVFVVSAYWKEALMFEYGRKSVITHNGLDPGDFDPLPPRKATTPTVLYVGGLEPRKGLEYLVLAMEQVMREVPETRLVAIAKTGFKGTDGWNLFEELAERAGLKDRVDFRESVSHEELLQLYSDCDLLALPSRMEGWGISLMEAMTCGKPVVASRVGGVPELVCDGVEGFLVDAGDLRGLSETIVRLLGDDYLRGLMGNAGRERVKEFSWDRTAAIVLSEYEKAVQADRPKSSVKRT